MKTLIFLVCLGGAYGLLSVFISDVTVAALLAWPVGFALYWIGIRVYFLALWHLRYKTIYEALDPETQARMHALVGVARSDAPPPEVSDWTEEFLLGVEEQFARDHRDRLYDEWIDRAGGLDSARTMVIGHLAASGLEVNEEEAEGILERWRVYGIPKNKSLGEHLDAFFADEIPVTAPEIPSCSSCGRQLDPTRGWREVEGTRYCPECWSERFPRATGLD